MKGFGNIDLEDIPDYINRNETLSRIVRETETDHQLRPTLDVLDVADYLKISKYTVINRIKQGQLKAYKQGIRWKIKREWLLEYEQNMIRS
ncbi:helix-turn-helix domain-containing protein [Paenibacillus sp. HN-1]|uniref:helix-turn-helix domain-containing protein n=1 Tax=Paenibacillus TaxID=44249 RepID=UPI001CA81366|nr:MULTISPECIES: helix-turn-helix domain-containing protein [Paenibacillus]MBY9079602.1 helix-turn-helix domain-containing protein [Paenibacillus sp. CGMCC 1.18879]MBY9084291.1 helix-turn-helix domain-containing protein [Paenibacillus sinensis]